MSERNEIKPGHVDLPNDVKSKLLALAQRLPEDGRKEFVQRVATRVSGVVADHPNTLVFAVLGSVLGLAVDRLLTFHLPLVGLTLEVTGGRGLLVGLCAGSVYGLSQDHRVEHKIRAIVASEMRRSMAPAFQEGAA